MFLTSRDASSNKRKQVFALIDFSSETEAHSVLCVQNSLLIGIIKKVGLTEFLLE